MSEALANQCACPILLLLLLPQRQCLAFSCQVRLLCLLLLLNAAATPMSGMHSAVKVRFAHPPAAAAYCANGWHAFGYQVTCPTIKVVIAGDDETIILLL
jgi:hypothetical protein